MDIRYHKSGSITIKNREVDIMVGADFDLSKVYPEKVWLANPRLAVVDYGSVPKDKVLINGPGEYEVGGVDIFGVKYGEKSLAYLLTIDDYRVGIIFEDGQVEELVDKFESLDVLVVLNPMIGLDKQLTNLTKKVGVNFLVLVGSKQENKYCLDAFDREDIVPVEKLSLKSGQEMAEGLEVVLLSA